MVLVCEPAAGPAESCLDLVEDQQEVLLVTPAADAFKVAASCGDNPDLAHDRLEHHRHRLVGGGWFDGVGGVVVGMKEAGRGRLGGGLGSRVGPRGATG